MPFIEFPPEDREDLVLSSTAASRIYSESAEAAKVTAVAAANSLTPEMVAKLNVYDTIADAEAAVVDTDIFEIHTQHIEDGDNIRRTWQYRASEPDGLEGIQWLKTNNNRHFRCTAQDLAGLATGQSLMAGVLYDWDVPATLPPPANLWVYDLEPPLAPGTTTGWNRARTDYINPELARYAAFARRNRHINVFVVVLAKGSLPIDRWVGMPYNFTSAGFADGEVAFNFPDVDDVTEIYLSNKDLNGETRAKLSIDSSTPTAIRFEQFSNASNYVQYDIDLGGLAEGGSFHTIDVAWDSGAGAFTDGMKLRVLFGPNIRQRMLSEARPALTAIDKDIFDEVGFFQGQSDAFRVPQENWLNDAKEWELWLVSAGYTAFQPPTTYYAVSDERKGGFDPHNGFNKLIRRLVREAPHRSIVDTPLILANLSLWEPDEVHTTGLGDDILGTVADGQKAAGAGQDSVASSLVVQAPTAIERGSARENIGAGELAGYRNKVINGSMAINQRGITYSLNAAATGFTLDGWYISNQTNQTATISQQAYAVADSPIRNFLQIAFSVAPTTGFLIAEHRVEDVATLAELVATMTAHISSPADMAAVISAITPFLAIVAGLLGYVAMDTSRLKALAVTGESQPTVASAIAKAVLPKRK